MRLTFLILFIVIIISSCSDQITKNRELLSENLVAHYPLNNSSEDISDFNNDGIVIGAKAISDRNNNQNAAYQFDGLNDRIIFPFSEVTNFDASSDNFSISLWVKGDSTNFPDCRIFQKWDDILSSPYMISIQAGFNKCHAIIYDTQTLNIVHFGNIWDNKWHHLVAVIDNSNKFFSIYLDGNLVDQTNITLELSTKSDFILTAGGIENSCQTRFMRGAIDNIRLYNKSLSESEISILCSE